MAQEGLDDPNDLFNDSVLEWLSLTCPTGASDPVPLTYGFSKCFLQSHQTTMPSRGR